MTRIAARMKARRTKTNSAETRDDSLNGATAASYDHDSSFDVKDGEDDEHIYDDLPEPAVKGKGWRSKLANEKKKLEGKFQQMKTKYDNKFKTDKT